MKKIGVFLALAALTVAVTVTGKMIQKKLNKEPEPYWRKKR